MTYEALLKAVQTFFGDTSRPAHETAEGLESLKDEIDMLLESLR
jgi:hypothetical protein